MKVGEAYQIAQGAILNKKLALKKVQSALEHIKNNVSDGLLEFNIEIEDDDTISILRELGYIFGKPYREGRWNQYVVDVKIIPNNGDFIRKSISSDLTFVEKVKSIINAVLYNNYGRNYNQNPNIVIANIICGELFHEISLDKICDLAKIVESNIDCEVLEGGIDYENIVKYIDDNIRKK